MHPNPRRNCFYPKADWPSPPGELAAGAVHALEAACSDILRESIRLEPLTDQGTWHRVWRIRRSGGASLVCRANAFPESFRDDSLTLEAHFSHALAAFGVPRPAILAVDLSRRRCPVDFMILEEAPGMSLAALDDDDERLTPLLRDLGRVMARLHRVPIDEGFGLLDPRSTVIDRLLGSCETWDNYLQTRLTSHVKTCVSIGAITPGEGWGIEALFEAHRGLFTDTRPSLLHGDPGNHNVFGANGRVTGLIDWEDALAGDPIFDVAFWATFHPERRHTAFVQGYSELIELPEDFDQRFWLYYLRISLAKTVVRHRLGIEDIAGRPAPAGRVQHAMRRIESAGARV
jgi:aminoglycoside phosphotransferase (APT) family kinase protein